MQQRAERPASEQFPTFGQSAQMASNFVDGIYGIGKAFVDGSCTGLADTLI